MALLVVCSLQLNAQEFVCSTVGGPDVLAGSQNLLVDEPVYIRVYFHAVRKTDGTGGVTSDQVNESFSILNQYFNPHNIYFLWDCEIDPIDDTNYWSNIETNLCPIVQENVHADGIDIYIGPDINTHFGKSEDIPGKWLLVGGTSPVGYPWSRSPVIAHEMGHCLGLYHTFHGTVTEGVGITCGITVGDLNECAECAGGMDGNCGDYVSDTPADPYGEAYSGTWDYFTCENSIEIFDNCAQQYFEPDGHNIMSYSRLNCTNHFSQGQAKRMQTLIAITPELQNTLVERSITISSGVIGDQCPGNTFYVNYTVCLNGEPNTPVDLTLDVVILNPDPPTNGITLGGDFVNGSAMVSATTDCNTVTLEVTSDISVNNPTTFDLQLSALSGDPSVSVNIENCGLNTITVGPLHASFTFEEIGPCLYQFTSDKPEPGTHLWDFGDGTTSTDPNPIHQYYYDQIVDITHTLTSGCGFDQETEDNLILICQTGIFQCEVSNPVKRFGIPGVTSHSSDYPIFIPTLTGKVSIAGHFIVDSPVTFNGAEVYMDPGSTLEVAENVHDVYIRNTDIHGCGEMWNSIIVNNGSVVSVGNESTIEDAYAAFTAREGATLNIENTTFNRNLAGIASTSGFSLTMTGTIFDCTSALALPLEGHYSEVGIRVSDGNLVSIGINGTTPNEFRNLNNGILALRNSLLVQNTNFSNIRQQGSDSYPHLGFGIRAESVNAPLSAFTVTQTGNGKNGALSFTDCTHGIYVRGMAVDVSGNKMTGMNRGITTGFCHTDINIRDNDMSCRLSGIEMLQSDLNSTRTIKDNHITLTYKSNGITVDESAVILTEPLDGVIRKNTIDFSPTAAGPGSGIRLTSSIFYNLYDNTVNINQAVGNVTGIFVSGGTFNTLDYNHVFGNNDDANTGIWGYSCPDVLWQCNDVHNTSTGFRYNLPCNSTDKFRGNIMSNHQTGLRLGGGVDINGLGARLGIQNHKGNKWIGTFNSSLGAARHEGSFNDISQSIFRAQQTSPYWPPSIQTPQAPLANWFTSGTPGPKGAYTCSGPEFDEEETDGADEMIAGGDPSPDSTVRWLSGQYLYRKLSRNPSYIANATAFQVFMDDNDETTVGRFYDVETAVGSLFTIDATSLGQLLANYGLQKEKTDSIRLVDSLLVTATGNDSLSLLTARTLLFQQYLDLAQNSQGIIGNVLSQRAANATAIITDNGSITTTQLFEQNEQLFNDIFLNTVAMGDLDFTATQVTDLQDIAYQCPAEGGNAVFKARAMLSVITQEDFDDEEICSGLDEREGKEPNAFISKKESSFHIHPNPARDLVTIEWDNNKAESFGQITIQDLAGREVLRKTLTLSDGKANLAIAHLSSGAYWCKVTIDGEVTHSERIVLIK